MSTYTGEEHEIVIELELGRSNISPAHDSAATNDDQFQREKREGFDVDHDHCDEENGNGKNRTGFVARES